MPFTPTQPSPPSAASTPGPRHFVSDAIDIARLICIVGVIYIHAWTGRTGDVLATLSATPQGELRWTLAELLSRSAVPLLGLISGWLAARSVTTRGYGEFLGGKVRTLLVPMLLWNAIAMSLVCTAGTLGWLSAPHWQGWWWSFNELFCLTTPNDVNVQMYFLRDIFVCMAAAPLLAKLPDWALWTIGAVAAAWTVSDLNLYLLLKPQILMFVCLGMLIRRHAWESRLARAPWLLAILPFILIAPLKIYASAVGGDPFARAHPHLLNGLDLVIRVAVAFLFWRVAATLARSRFNALLQKLAPLAFLIFCSHMVFLWFGGPAIGKLSGPLGAPAYPLFLILQPVLVVAAVMALREGLRRLSPSALDVLSGKRGADAQLTTSSTASRPPIKARYGPA